MTPFPGHGSDGNPPQPLCSPGEKRKTLGTTRRVVHGSLEILYALQSIITVSHKDMDPNMRTFSRALI